MTNDPMSPPWISSSITRRELMFIVQALRTLSDDNDFSKEEKAELADVLERFKRLV